MKTFKFYFGCNIGKLILNQTDQLSRALQSETLSAAEGFDLAQVVVKTLEKDRTEDAFDLGNNS